MFSRIGEVD